MIRAAAFNFRHLDNFKPAKDLFEIEFEKHLLDALKRNDFIVTIFFDKEPKFIIGFRYISSNVAEIWQYNSDSVGTIDIGGFRELKSVFEDRLIKSVEKHLIRVQALCDPDKVNECKWLEFFGFNREGELKNFYDKGKSQYIYGRAL